MTADTRPWGIHNDYGPLKDVLLGMPTFYRWIDAGPITMRTLNNQKYTAVEFNLQTAMSQHAQMVAIYESNGVTCHYLDADEALHRNFFAPRLERNDSLGCADLPYATQEPARRLCDRHPLLSEQ